MGRPELSESPKQQHWVALEESFAIGPSYIIPAIAEGGYLLERHYHRVELLEYHCHTWGYRNVIVWGCWDIVLGVAAARCFGTTGTSFSASWHTYHVDHPGEGLHRPRFRQLDGKIVFGAMPHVFYPRSAHQRGSVMVGFVPWSIN